MLKIIEPTVHEVYQSEIDTLLYLFQLSQRVDLPLEEQARSTFIMAKDPKCGVYGGAILRKKPFSAFDETIEAALSTLHSRNRKVWFVQLCACMVECETLSREDKIKLFKTFYSSLYKKFMKFGKQKKTNFLVLSLSPSDYAITNTYQEWPYVLEVLPNNTLDNHFQGILDIKPAKRKDNKKVKSYPDPANQVEETDL